MPEITIAESRAESRAISTTDNQKFGIIVDCADRRFAKVIAGTVVHYTDTGDISIDPVYRNISDLYANLPPTMHLDSGTDGFVIAPIDVENAAVAHGLMINLLRARAASWEKDYASVAPSTNGMMGTLFTAERKKTFNASAQAVEQSGLLEFTVLLSDKKPFASDRGLNAPTSTFADNATNSTVSVLARTKEDAIKIFTHMQTAQHHLYGIMDVLRPQSVALSAEVLNPELLVHAPVTIVQEIEGSAADEEFADQEFSTPRA